MPVMKTWDSATGRELLTFALPDNADGFYPEMSRGGLPLDTADLPPASGCFLPRRKNILLAPLHHGADPAGIPWATLPGQSAVSHPRPAA